MSTDVEDGTWPGPLSASVARLCSEVREQVRDSTARGLDEVLRRLSAPLRLAVAGRMKSGKSTLVNALIGRRVAPTDVGECTRLVTRYQYGRVDHVEIVFRDGDSRAIPFDADGGIPADLGVDLERVSHLEAYLTNAVLRDLTVIDTPGLNSPESASAARAEKLLGVGERDQAGNSGNSTNTDDTGKIGHNPSSETAAARAIGHGATVKTSQEVEHSGETAPGGLDPVSRSAVVGAEAVLYVVTQAVRADDQHVLSAFVAATAAREAGPGNALAVLNKADTVEPDSLAGSDGDVWTAAEILARRQAESLRPGVTEALPVIGLLAETAETDAFGTTEADVLRRLAALDATTRQMLLLSTDLFTTWQCAVPESERATLLQRLDLYGVRCAIEAIDDDHEITAGALRRRLREASGLDDVVERVDSVFRARADGIKAAAALASISALVDHGGDSDERQCVHDAIEALLAEPEAHHLRVLEALTLVSCGAVSMPDDLVAEVVRVGSATSIDRRLGLSGRGHQELVDYALERAGWWRSFASFGATPAQSRVAHVVHRAYFLMWQQLKADTASVAPGRP